MAIDDWSTRRLAEVTSKVGSGATPRGGANSYKDEGISLIRSLNVYDLRFELPGLALVDQTQADELDNVEVLSGDVLLNITGASVARCCLVPDRVLPARVNQHVSIVRPKREALDSRFLAYSLVSPLNKSRLLAVAQGGATREALTKQKIQDFEILVPPLATQHKIAGILAAYDELIENNLRRIEILEEMAQAIYREWFVNFRYPGYEAAELVESPLGRIPRGWDVGPFSEHADFINGYAFKPSHWMDAGKPIIKIKELKNGVMDETPRYHGADLDERYHVDTGDLLFSWSADLDAYLWRHEPGLLNQHLFKVVPRDEIERAFLFHALVDRMPEFRQRAQGTTMRHIKRAALSEVLVVVPSAEVRRRFAKVIDPMHRLLEVLTAQNTNLRATRDLLLPKLVSGELDVSDLDIDTSWLTP